MVSIMESDEFRTVRVYTKKYTSKDKDGNTVEKESQQKQVSLKKEDPFEDDDLVKVLTQKDYEKLLDNQFSDAKLDEFHHTIEAKDAEIATLKDQIQTLKASFFDDVDSLKDQLTDKEELIKAKDEIHELNKKITKIDDERVAIFKELDYKNNEKYNINCSAHLQTLLVISYKPIKTKSRQPQLGTTTSSTLEHL